MNTNQLHPVPEVVGADGTRFIIGMRVRCCLDYESEIGEVEGELIKIARNGFFIYVKLDKKLLLDSTLPEILISPGSLWVCKRSL